MNWALSPYGTKRMQMALMNSQPFGLPEKKKSLILSGLPSKLHEIPCSLRDWLPKKEFKREIRRLLLDILVQESDYIDTPACPSHKKFDWPDS